MQGRWEVSTMPIGFSRNVSPRRLRPYFAHVPKVITRGLHHESSLMFREALFTSSQRRFRDTDVW